MADTKLTQAGNFLKDLSSEAVIGAVIILLNTIFKVATPLLIVLAVLVFLDRAWSKYVRVLEKRLEQKKNCINHDPKI